MGDMLGLFAESNVIALGILASLVAGLATSVGAIPIFFTKDISKQVMKVQNCAKLCFLTLEAFFHNGFRISIFI